MHIRRGRPQDLPTLIQLEADGFEPERRESRSVFVRSLRSPHQEVWVSTEGGRITGSLFLRIHKQTARIYSIAIDPAVRGKGTGSQLIEWAAKRALKRGCSVLSLEADARNRKLLDWYARQGFSQAKVLEDYYAPGWPALRFCRDLKVLPGSPLPNT